MHLLQFIDTFCFFAPSHRLSRQPGLLECGGTARKAEWHVRVAGPAGVPHMGSQPFLIRPRCLAVGPAYLRFHSWKGENNKILRSRSSPGCYLASTLEHLEHGLVKRTSRAGMCGSQEHPLDEFSVSTCSPGTRPGSPSGL